MHDSSCQRLVQPDQLAQNREQDSRCGHMKEGREPGPAVEIQKKCPALNAIHAMLIMLTVTSAPTQLLSPFKSVTMSHNPGGLLHYIQLFDLPGGRVYAVLPICDSFTPPTNGEFPSSFDPLLPLKPPQSPAWPVIQIQGRHLEPVAAAGV